MPSGLGGYQPDTKSASSRRADFDLLRRVAVLERGGGNGGGGVRSGACALLADAAQSIPHATWTKVVLSGTSLWNDGGWVLSNGEFVCPADGRYLVTGSVQVQTTAFTQNSRWDVAIRVNDALGSFIPQEGSSAPTGMAPTQQMVTAMLNLVAGDRVQLWVYQATGAARQFYTVLSYTWMQVERVGSGLKGDTGPAGPPGGTPYGLAVYTTTTAVASSTYTPLGLGTPLWNDGAFTISGTDAVCQQAGRYLLMGAIRLTGSATAAGVLWTQFFLNGALSNPNIRAGYPAASGAPNPPHAIAVGTLNLVVGDRVSLVAWQSIIPAGSDCGLTSWLRIERVGAGPQGPTGAQGPQGIQGVPGDLTQAVADDLYVNVTGDTMTGQLQITDPVESLRLARTGATSPHLGFYNDTFTTRYSYIMGSAADLYLNHATGPLRFGPGNSEAARFDAAGQFLINKTASNYNATGMEVATDGRLVLSDSNTTAAQTLLCNLVSGGVTSGRRFVSFRLNNSEIGTITRSGATSAVLYNTTSDYRMKEDHGLITGALDRLAGLVPRRVIWKSDPARQVMDGFFAHEVAEAVPEAVTGVKDAMTTDDDGNEVIDPQQLDPSKLIPLLVAAVQELSAEVAELRAQLAAK